MSSQLARATFSHPTHPSPLTCHNQRGAELHALAAAGVNVTHLELGNEFYIGKDYDWRFPTAREYAAEPVYYEILSYNYGL